MVRSANSKHEISPDFSHILPTMNKHIFFALSGIFALLAAGCGSTPVGPAGSISGTLHGAEGKVVELKVQAGKGMLSLASTTVADDGSFQLVPAQGLVPDYYYLIVDNKKAMDLITDST